MESNKGHSMNRAEWVAEAIWSSSCSWQHARTRLSGARMAVAPDSPDHAVYDFLYKIAVTLYRMETEQ